jgi:predicted RNA-binding Zn-ribbon protein involved in translation (DUF1610 family)
MDLYDRHCKDCGKIVRVNKHYTFFRCNECKEKLKQERLTKKSKNECTNCGQIFEKDPHSRDYHCPECKMKVTILKTHTRCSRCNRVLSRDNFPKGHTTVCFDCRDRHEQEKDIRKNAVYIRNCIRCNKEVPATRFATIVLCNECEEIKQQQKIEKKKKIYVRKCLTCGKDVQVRTGRITFIHCTECKSEFIKAKTDSREFKDNSFKCKFCGNRELVSQEDKERYNYKNFICNPCRIEPHYKVRRVEKKCVICDNVIMADIRRTTIVCNECEAAGRKPDLIKFGIKMNYGYRGISSDGHKWWSLNEQDLEEWLISKNIRHVPQKRIGESLKHADQYLPDFDLYIEMDGLRRKDDIDWCGKLSLYKRLNLKYKIVEPAKVHFNDDPEKCFIDLNEKLSFLMEKA